jgi:hypothetical protein
LILLVCACVYGCGNDDKKETTVSTKDAIRLDDSLIMNMDRNCQALLAEEEFFASADETVKVYVAGNGDITVEGLNAKSSKFLQLLKTYVYGAETATYSFASEVYRQGEPTTLQYTFNAMLYSWSSQVSNHNEGSRYCRAK